jgi:simple sugar transport system ATP-binding protein
MSLTVMKDGQVVANRTVDSSLTVQDIVNLMLGRSFEENFPKIPAPIGDVVIEVEHLRDGEGKVRDVSFSIRSGEIVGVCGLVGAGKTELCKLLFGANRMGAGTIRYKGKPISVHSPTSAVRQKIALVPEERRKEGVLVSEPVYFNLSAACLGKFANRFSFIVRSLEIANAKKLVGDLGIKTPSVYQRVKWITSDSDIYMLDAPTKGVDVGAKRDIFQLIQSLAKQGKAVLYASSEINEILAITDRLYVMYNGEFVTELETHKTTEEEILYYATGGRK